MRPTVAQLEALTAVARTGSISAAAREVGVAQPTLSATLARLERQAGVGLLQRSSRGVHLTEAGQAVCTAAERALEAVDVVEAVCAHHAGRPAPVRIAASYTVAEHLLPAWLVGCRIPTEVEVCNSAQVQQEVLSGAAEIGFIEGSSVEPGLHARVLAHDDLVLVVAPTHPWARLARPLASASQDSRRRRLASARTLASRQPGPARRESGHISAPDSATTIAAAQIASPPPQAGTLVLREEGSGARQVLEEALTERGYQLPDHIQVMGSNAAVVAAVAQSGAFAFLARAAATAALESGRLMEVPCELPLGRTLRLVTAATPLRPQARELIQALHLHV